jgi:DNA modification methylase
MQTEHKLFLADARQLAQVASASVDLVVTSPPYPMITMWDELFIRLNPQIAQAREAQDHRLMFELMHAELDKVWLELWRVLKPGALACINMGDATRTIDENFRLYANHARLVQFCYRTGFDILPAILWRKQTNAPNKFMGSGMLPAGAYVTLEHEYIIILRKGAKRLFASAAAKANRRRSALFWEERNVWFSDVWDFKGKKQELRSDGLRTRSAAYPFELAFRLINMYSVLGDTVLDPFLGTGTTMLAAAACGRNSLGYELDANFGSYIKNDLLANSTLLNSYNLKRLQAHRDFIRMYPKALKHRNVFFGFPVVTGQETQLELTFIKDISAGSETDFTVTYLDATETAELTKEHTVSAGQAGSL